MDNSLFFSLQHEHTLYTADRLENHFMSLTHLVLKKYLAMRLKKTYKEAATHSSLGNYLHRSRIFKNV